MSGDVIERKAHYIGQWKGNVVTDTIIQHLRAKSEADRGKKVKVRLSRHGIQIRKSAMFQGSTLFDSYRMDDIFFMTVNQQNKSCLLCIVRDEKQKYAILAFRCASDYDAGLFVQTFKALKTHSKQDRYEMTRKADGNWTLRNRSGVPSRQYLQVPQSRPVNGAPNGDVRHVQHTPISNQTMLPDPDGVTKEEMYLKGRKQHNIGIQTSKSHELDTDQMSDVSDVSAFKDELESLSQELREIKYLLEKSTGISAEEYLRQARESGAVGNNNNYEIKQVPSQMDYPDGTARVYVSHRPPPVLVSNPVSIGSTSEEDVFATETDYRSYGSQTVPVRSSRTPNIKTSEVASVLKREFSSSHVEDMPRVMAVPLPVGEKASTLPQNGHTVVSGHTNGVIDGHVSGGSSVRVKFDPKSMRVSNDNKTRSMRMSSDFMVPSTVEKSIEKTYARPTILRPGYVYDSHRPHHVRRNRPQSVYIMTGAQPMKVQNPKPMFEAHF